MGRITSSIGLSTGINIEDTVNKLMELASQPKTTATARKAALGTQQAAITDLTASTLGVQFAVKRLATTSLFTKRAVTSSSTLLTATATSGVAPGTYQFTAVRQAQNAQVLSSGVASKDAPLGVGTFSFRFGGAITSPVSLDELNGGAGVTRGKIRIIDRNGGAATIDLRYAQTIDDVVNAINSTDTADITASVEGDRLKITDRSGGSGNLRVQEVSGGSTAADLGLSGINVAANSATGNDVLKLQSDLALSQLNDGNGLSIRTGVSDLNVTLRDGTSLSVDFNRVSPPRTEKTLGDLINTINEADPTKLRAEISADGDRIVLTDLTTDTGGTFAVSSTSGGSLAEDLGLTGTATGGTLNSGRLRGGLQSPLLRTLNGGQGLGTLGTINLTDRSGATASIDLSGAETLDDVTKAINGAGLGLRAEINSARNGLQIVDTTNTSTSNLIVADGDANNTATKLGIVGSVSTDTIRGGTLSRQIVSENTSLSDYNAGQGVRTGSFLIKDSNGREGAINFTTLQPKTIGDVISAINNLALGVTAKINDTGDGIALVDTGGGSQRLTVTDVGGGKTAADLRLTTTATDTTVGGNPAQVIGGSTAFNVTLDADDTLTDLVTKLNALGANVTASIVTDGAGTLRNHLSLVSGIAGRAGDLLVDGNGVGLKFQTLTAAQDALVSVGGANGRLVSSTSNKFTNVVEGLDISITGASTDTINVSVAASSTDVESAVQLFVDQYNKLRDKMTSYTFYNTSDDTKGTLFGSSDVVRLDSDLSRAVTQRYFTTGSVRSFSELGISLDDSGKMTFDKSRLQARYQSDPDGLTSFFTDATSGFAKKVDDTLERLVGRDNSTLVNRAKVLQQQLEDSTTRIDFLTTMLDKQRERLTNQFYAMETAISKIKSSASAIDSIKYINPDGTSS
ncbi:flagellar filament capping protein FliD [Anatilimnocola floriformis]|uniref:flagellar filament capping protein FliD n=1 Tax=Anatilimnocola floriformis TaxID=2948575 RepID=UPI0020C301B7|nr:flagellar filament capping protein FliD [Anatilimnocola floriformis]